MAVDINLNLCYNIVKYITNNIMEAIMELEKVLNLIDGELLIGNIKRSMNTAFSSDLMSDVLAFVEEDTVLITGLINNQVIRTAEMLDLKAIIFVRGKVPAEDVIKMAEIKDITLLRTKFTLFETSGILYKNGLGALKIYHE